MGKETDEKLQRLRASRKAHRGKITQYINKVNDVLDGGTLLNEGQFTIKNLKTRLKQKKGTLDTIDNKILAICDHRERNRRKRRNQLQDNRSNEQDGTLPNSKSETKRTRSESHLKHKFNCEYHQKPRTTT